MTPTGLQNHLATDRYEESLRSLLHRHRAVIFHDGLVDLDCAFDRRRRTNERDVFVAIVGDNSVGRRHGLTLGRFADPCTRHGDVGGARL